MHCRFWLRGSRERTLFGIYQLHVTITNRDFDFRRYGSDDGFVVGCEDIEKFLGFVGCQVVGFDGDWIFGSCTGEVRREKGKNKRKNTFGTLTLMVSLRICIFYEILRLLFKATLKPLQKVFICAI